MNNTIQHTEAILSRHISGFHQYVLSEPVHLSFVSHNLCAMLGFAAEELLSDTEDLYAPLVHPADRETYASFIHTLSQTETTHTLQYRLVKQDGTVLYVSDTMTSQRLEDGTLVGSSVLTDITGLKAENDNLQFLNETIPCGFLKYTCEKQPRITYINDQMLKMLRFPEVREGELNYLELYKDNIFLMIPMEERRRFALYLNRVYSQGGTHRRGYDGAAVRRHQGVSVRMGHQMREREGDRRVPERVYGHYRTASHPQEEGGQAVHQGVDRCVRQDL